MRRRVAFLVAAALVLGGCVGWWRGPRCRDQAPSRTERRALEARRPHPESPLPPHPEYAQLRPFRSYFRLDRVEPLAHHFAVYYACVERSVEIYAARRDPQTAAPRLELERGTFGLASIPSARAVTPPPEAAADLGEAVRRRVARQHRHERRLVVSYLGEYRVVTFSELVPGGMPGEPTRRGAVRMTVELHASATLDRLVDDRVSYEGGSTRLCWTDWGTCGAAPRWFDFEPLGHDGTERASRLLRAWGRSPAFEGERARLVEAALGAARELEQAAPRRPLGSLAAQRVPLLPPDLELRLHYGFQLYARPRDLRLDRQEEATADVWLPVRAAAFGVARGQGVARIAGLRVTLDAELGADEPLPADATGEREVPMTLRLRLADERGNVRAVAVALHQRLLIGAGRAGVLRFGPPKGSASPAATIAEEQRHRQLPGHGEFRAIDAYLFSGT